MIFSIFLWLRYSIIANLGQMTAFLFFTFNHQLQNANNKTYTFYISNHLVLVDTVCLLYQILLNFNIGAEQRVCVCVCVCVCVRVSECVCDVQTGRQCEEAELSPSQLAFSASYLIMAHSNANELKDQPCGCKVCVCV